jgi:murein DD-endopeptidase MepM/ murein hydrolase activator NlpD
MDAQPASTTNVASIESVKGSSVLIARQDKAEAQFFGFGQDDEAESLAYAEFSENDEGGGEDISLELDHPLPMTRRDSDARSGGRGTRAKSPSSSGQASAAPARGPLDLLWPVVGGISSPFGMRRGRLHAGIDIRANRGTPIFASQSGQVLLSSRRRAYGNVVVIGHDHSFQTLYAHLQKMIVRSGQYVDQGDVIGYVGRTGRATGYHLHFETRVAGGVPQDPMRSLPALPRAQARLESSVRSSM